MKTIGNKLVVKEIETPSQTDTGLFIPETSEKDYKKGEVVAVGEGTEKEPMNISVGDVVLYPKYSGNAVEVDGEEYKVLEQSNVLVVL